jgi:hypothetical protein
MPTQTPHELEQQIAHHLDALHRELGPDIPRERVLTVGRHHIHRLLAHATITDFIPLLVYRSTKEELMHADRVYDTVAAAA